jgi:hypothetical protein
MKEAQACEKPLNAILYLYSKSFFIVQMMKSAFESWIKVLDN